MKDFFGRELALNDYVVLQQQHYRGYKLGKIIKFTPQKVRVKYGESKYMELLQSPEQLIKVEGEEVLVYALKHGGI